MSKDGTLSFEEFKAGFTPLVTFQIHQLRGRVVEIKRSRTRVERERERELSRSVAEKKRDLAAGVEDAETLVPGAAGAKATSPAETVSPAEKACP